MNGWMRVAIIVAAGGASIGVAALSIGLGRKLIQATRGWGKKSPEEMERLRRLDLNRRGRITPAHVVDFIEDGPPGALRRMVVYRYEVAGVTYEAAQDVSTFAGAELLTRGGAGLSSSAKYDPHAPLNSMIACEEWNGLDAGN